MTTTPDSSAITFLKYPINILMLYLLEFYPSTVNRCIQSSNAFYLIFFGDTLQTIYSFCPNSENFIWN